MQRRTKIELKRGRMVISLPLQKLRPSKSGKTLLIATIGGARRTGLFYKGREVFVTANAYVYETPKQSKRQQSVPGKGARRAREATEKQNN